MPKVAGTQAVRMDGRVQTELHSPRHPAPIQPEKPILIENFQPFEGHEDVTVLMERNAFLDKLGFALQEGVALPNPLGLSLDFTARIQIELPGERPISKPCRVHAASAFGGDWFSVTLRGLEFPNPPSSGPKRQLPSWEPGRPPETPQLRAERLEWPPPKDRGKDFGRGFLVCQWHVAEVIHDSLFHEGDAPAKGLVLITGATASGKTQLLNHMVGKYLCGLLKNCGNRRPHAVALGDPVETLLFQGIDKEKPRDLQEIAGELKRQNAKRAFDYTARVLGLDTYCIADALKDALRETPAAYIISELRSESDFQAALDFAATGHAVFATAHSTSLVDAVTKLVEVSNAETPSQRAALAQRLKAVVHVRPIGLGEPYAQYSVALPAIWRADSIAVRNFVADGLASLLPHGVSRFGGSEGSVLGLAYTAEKLRQHDFVRQSNPACGCADGHFDGLVRKAHEKDLEAR